MNIQRNKIPITQCSATPAPCSDNHFIPRPHPSGITRPLDAAQDPWVEALFGMIFLGAIQNEPNHWANWVSDILLRHSFLFENFEVFKRRRARKTPDLCN